MWPARGRAPGLKWTGHVTCKLSFSMVRQLSCQAQLPGRQLSCHPLLPGRQLSCHPLLPGWQLSCQALLPGGGSSAARLAAQLPDPAAQLPDLGSSAAERCNDNCMHAFNHPAEKAPRVDDAPAKLRPQGVILHAHAAELARELRHSVPPRLSRAGGTERSSEFGCVLMCGSPLCAGCPNGAQAARCPLEPRIERRNLPGPCT